MRRKRERKRWDQNSTLDCLDCNELFLLSTVYTYIYNTCPNNSAIHYLDDCLPLGLLCRSLWSAWPSRNNAQAVEASVSFTIPTYVTPSSQLSWLYPSGLCTAITYSLDPGSWVLGYTVSHLASEGSVRDILQGHKTPRIDVSDLKSESSYPRTPWIRKFKGNIMARMIMFFYLGISIRGIKPMTQTITAHSTLICFGSRLK